MADYQDFKPVVLRKNPNKKPQTAHEVARAKARGQVETQRKFNSGTNHSAGPSNARALEEETADFKHQTVTHEFKVALMQARQKKNMTQKQLAQQLAIKQSVINEYESGKAIPNPQLISKLNRILGTRLPKIPKKKKVQE